MSKNQFKIKIFFYELFSKFTNLIKLFKLFILNY